MYNLLHHSGVIYDTIFYLRKHQATSGELAKMDGEAERNWWFKLGIYYGTLTRMILYTGEEPVPYDAF